ncbi:hypothetical protein [Nitrosopumilus sp.]|uniref:hypothetical protein n=1 Tax=Nitrosopumilus sp. TaxID=2024843 RepID=UPI0034A07F13
MEEESKFKIIFEKMDEAIKDQKNIQSIDFDQLMKISEEIRNFEKIVNDATIDEDYVVLTRA